MMYFMSAVLVVILVVSVLILAIQKKTSLQIQYRLNSIHYALESTKNQLIM